jgi:hypothetical protein
MIAITATVPIFILWPVAHYISLDLVRINVAHNLPFYVLVLIFLCNRLLSTLVTRIKAQHDLYQIGTF